LLIILVTTLTSCFCRRPVSSVCSCFHTIDLARRNAARVFVVRSNTIRHQMWHNDGSSPMTLWPGKITVQSRWRSTVVIDQPHDSLSCNGLAFRPGFHNQLDACWWNTIA
jgi:hypothetical protein